VADVPSRFSVTPPHEIKNNQSSEKELFEKWLASSLYKNRKLFPVSYRGRNAEHR
jgi:hypothetical protein